MVAAILTSWGFGGSPFSKASCAAPPQIEFAGASHICHPPSLTSLGLLLLGRGWKAQRPDHHHEPSQHIIGSISSGGNKPLSNSTNSNNTSYRNSGIGFCEPPPCGKKAMGNRTNP